MQVQSFDHLLNIFLSADDHTRRISAIQALAAAKESRAVQPLVDYLEKALNRARKDRPGSHYCTHFAMQTELQWEVIAALGEIGDERAIKPLLQALEHRFLYSEALRALTRLGGSHALKVLIHNYPGLRVYSTILEDFAPQDSTSSSVGESSI